MADVTGTGSGRVVTAGITSGSAAVTAAAGTFNPATDVGRPVSGTGIPANATLSAVASATAATLSANATATNASAALRLGPHASPTARANAALALGYDGWTPESDAEKLAYTIKDNTGGSPPGPGHREPTRVTTPTQQRDPRNRRAL
jgi:hypothetical protein